MTHDYMDLGEFVKKLDEANNAMVALAKDPIRIAVDKALVLVKRRVKTKGVSAEGTSFSMPYSKSHEYKKKHYGKGGYGTIISMRNFTFQDNMWDRFKVMKVDSANKMVTCRLGFEGTTSAFTKAGVKGGYPYEEIAKVHSDREGIAIGMLNEDEQKALTKEIGYALGQLLDNNL